MSSPSIAVVLPVLIREPRHVQMTMKCISLARRHTAIPFDLIIVESGSSYFRGEADVHVYEAQVTTPERSHNRGFRIACEKDFIVLLTNDVFVSDNWIESLIECFSAKPDCGCSTLASTQFGHSRESKIEEGNWWSVACVKREVFETVGFYDERFINSWCDTDLLVRIYKHGWKMYRNFNTVVEHLVGQTIYSKPGFQQNYDAGQALFQQKHESCGLPIYEAVK